MFYSPLLPVHITGGALGILSGTLQLKASPNPPDGTDDVIKKNLKSARTDASDVQRYCAQ